MLRGVTHVHSSYSFDGRLPLGDVKEFFTTKGLDLLLLSEHIETLGVDAIRSVIAECRRLSTDRFLLMPGLEIEDLNLLVFGIEDVEPWTDLSSLIAQFQSQGAFFVLSHPAKLHAGALSHVQGIIEGVEVWNNKYDGRLTPRRQSLDLYRALCRERPALVPSCGLDFHRPSDYTNVYLEVFAERSRLGVLAALRAGDFQIVRRGRRIPIYAGDPWIDRTLFRLKTDSCTAAYDCASRVYRYLQRVGITVPPPMRRLLKHVF